VTTDGRAIAESYFDAWKSRDVDALGGLLADYVTFDGPMGSARGRDECITCMRKMAERIDDIVITSGDRTPTVNWSQVRDGQISRIQAQFDTGSH
jgi:ketosteroid isomerase-like protein